MKLSFLSLTFSRFLIIAAFFCAVSAPIAQIKEDDCDRDACIAESRIAQAEEQKWCFNPQTTDGPECRAARRRWIALIDLNCRRSKNEDNEADKSSDQNPNVPSPRKNCNFETPSPHNAKSFNRDFVENVVMPLLEKFPSSIPLEKKLLASAHAYAESAGNYQDKAKAFKPLKGNNAFNLQYDAKDCLTLSCERVPRLECLGAIKISDKPEKAKLIDPAKEEPHAGDVSIGKTPGTLCTWNTVYVYIRIYSSLQEAVNDYLRFLKEQHPNLRQKLEDGNASPAEVFEAMKDYGTKPTYKTNLANAVPQIIKAIEDYAQMQIDWMDKRIQCETGNQTSQPVIDVLKGARAEYEQIKEAAQNVLKNLPKPPVTPTPKK